MRRRIVFEIEAEGTENIIDSITKIMMDKVDLNCEFSISQEIVPEKRISEKKDTDSCIPSEQMHESAGEGNERSHS